jgi:hypothetical protein
MVANIDIWTVEDDIEKGMRCARVIAELIRKPNAFSGGVVKVCGSMGVLAPEKTEDESTWIKVVDCPRLYIVHFNKFQVADT